LLSDQGERLGQLVTPPDGDALRSFARRIEDTCREPVCAVIESMSGARFVHDTLEQAGWEVKIAAQRVKGLAPLACKTDKIDSHVLATLSHCDLVPAIWLPTSGSRGARVRPLLVAPAPVPSFGLADKADLRRTTLTWGGCHAPDLFGCCHAVGVCTLSVRGR
jgi:hypothetical protein